MKTLVIIAIERTGTNYLCSLLNHLPELEARFEIFANVGAISLHPSDIQAISKLADQRFIDKTDPALVQYLKGHVHPVLRLLEERLPQKKKVLSFKVFREHLPDPVLAELIQQHRVIFITRRVIDAYISFMKALDSAVWINQDTTQQKPTLNIDHFAYWYKQSSDYYSFCEAQYINAKQDKPVVLRYGEFTQGTNLENLGVVAQQVSCAVGIPLRVPAQDFHSVFHKQDKNTEIRDKVANWDEFSQQLKHKNLEKQAFSSFLLP